MKEETLMKACGLSRNEAKVYLALVKIGSSKAGRVSKEAAIDRTSTYNSLKGLMEKGLASYVTIGKVKWFQAAHPRNIREYLEGKLEEVTEIMPELEREYSAAKLQNNVRLYKGTKGVKTVLKMVLDARKESRVFGSENQLDERMPEFAAKFKAQAAKRGIRTRSIVRKGRIVEKERLRDVRFITLESESPVVTNIFGNKIAIIVWTETPEAILIDNADAAEAYRGYFDFMWNRTEKR
ncbi:HTH-type sugar sensing transcriptional regulator TrmBL1 [Candidatus Norongarragalina meridionalis]|nr:HTH-type sugar sensing transcriptional regulator TrmBL1 [Candidatus Norongarragalina meridionalis]